MEAQDELCAFAADVVAMLPEIPGASAWARSAVGGACAGAAGGGAVGADGSHEWLALWGVRLEWLVAAAVGVCTVCSAAMGPCCVGCRSPFLSIYLSVCLSVCLSVYLSIYLSIYLYSRPIC